MTISSLFRRQHEDLIPISPETAVSMANGYFERNAIPYFLTLDDGILRVVVIVEWNPGDHTPHAKLPELLAKIQATRELKGTVTPKESWSGAAFYMHFKVKPPENFVAKELIELAHKTAKIYYQKAAAIENGFWNYVRRFCYTPELIDRSVYDMNQNSLRAGIVVRQFLSMVDDYFTVKIEQLTEDGPLISRDNWKHLKIFEEIRRGK